jgi:uncharacterized lipoprotein YddW (UPF0748 family)
MKQILLILGFLLHFIFAIIPAEPTSGDSTPDLSSTLGDAGRGLWVVRHDITSPASIDSIIAVASRYGFSDLFVQIRGRGDAYYDSAYEPKAEELDDDFDPLAYLISRKGDNHFRIHAWINVFYLWSSDSLPKSKQHLVNQKPEWIVYPASASGNTKLSQRKGDSEGLYNSPLLPEVQNYILKIIDDVLSKYNIDGVHLDYIRFPGRDFDFHPWVRHQFQKLYILDPLEFKNDKEDFVQKYGYSGYELYYDRWSRFLRNGLSDFVKRLSKRIRKRNPDIVISAAVKADLALAHLNFYQEWDRWLSEGWIDWAIPMNYATDNVTFISRIRSMLSNGLMEKLWMGVSLYNQTENSAMDKIRAVRDLSLSGFVLFSYKQFQRNKRLQSLYIQEVINNGSK